MPNIDLTITISVIVALSAIITPLLTAIINNCHDTKIHKLNLKNQEYRDNILHERDYYEKYLEYAGRYIMHPDSKSLCEYSQYYFAVLSIAPEDIRKLMLSINSCIERNNWADATRNLEKIAPMIHTKLQIK